MADMVVPGPRCPTVVPFESGTYVRFCSNSFVFSPLGQTVCLRFGSGLTVCRALTGAGVGQHCDFTLRPGTPDDAEVIAGMIGELAEFERLGDINEATAESVRAELASDESILEVVIAFVGDEPAGMATFFPTYSTFAAKRGLYLEDIYDRASAIRALARV